MPYKQYRGSSTRPTVPVKTLTMLKPILFYWLKVQASFRMRGWSHLSGVYYVAETRHIRSTKQRMHHRICLIFMALLSAIRRFGRPVSVVAGAQQEQWRVLRTRNNHRPALPRRHFILRWLRVSAQRVTAVSLHWSVANMVHLQVLATQTQHQQLQLLAVRACPGQSLGAHPPPPYAYWRRRRNTWFRLAEWTHVRHNRILREIQSLLITAYETEGLETTHGCCTSAIFALASKRAFRFLTFIFNSSWF